MNKASNPVQSSPATDPTLQLHPGVPVSGEAQEKGAYKEGP